MAFAMSGLQKIGGSKNGQSVWHYKTTDALLTVDNTGYFDNGTTTNTGVRNLMAVGDMIVLHCTIDTTPTFGLAFVNSIVDGVIDTTNATAISIDSD
jgi:hypothetical protein